MDGCLSRLIAELDGEIAMNMWQYFDLHPFIGWCALWLMWGVFWVMAVGLNLVFRIINRVLRAINVTFRGWPPSHLDLDGDWQPIPKIKD